LLTSVFTTFPARGNDKFSLCFIIRVVQPDGIVGVLPGDFLPGPLPVSKDILQRCLIELILVHFVDGMTSKHESDLPGLSPPEQLPQHIQCKIFENLLHISSLSSAHTPGEQNFWCHREEYGKRQALRRKSLDTKNLQATKEQKKEKKVRCENRCGVGASDERIT
jgi:hypothetical protein